MPRKPTKGKRPKGTTIRDAYVIGAYTTVFKKHPGMSFADLAREAGQRQVKGAEIALAENGGGVIGMEKAVASMVTLRRD